MKGNNQYIQPYNDEQKLFIKNYYKEHTLKETVIAFNKKFNCNKSITAIKHVTVSNKMKSKYTIEHHYYTKEEDDFVQKLAKITNQTWKNIWLLFNQKFNTNIKLTALRNHYNKVKKITVITTHDSNFIDNHKPKQRYAIGTEIIRKKKNSNEQYIVVKVSDTYKANKSNWKLKHYIEWEKYNGPVPKNSLLIFLDGNTLNCNISNLKCVDKNLIKRILGNRYTPNYYGKNKITEAFIECINLEKVIKEGGNIK